mmetsp:Transcript_25833/g.36533  ORF Transcript_25833/g.36533 Transcript_25833/m.36533 type:complete len:613 (+) Transcript_25833:1263-3101(+)
MHPKHRVLIWTVRTFKKQKTYPKKQKKRTNKEISMLSQKVKTYLLDHCRSRGGEPVQVSRQKIAQSVGSKRVTFLRGALDELEAQGDIVKIGGHSVALSAALTNVETSLHYRDENPWLETGSSVNVRVRRSSRLRGRSSTGLQHNVVEAQQSKVEEIARIRRYLRLFGGVERAISDLKGTGPTVTEDVLREKIQKHCDLLFDEKHFKFWLLADMGQKNKLSLFFVSKTGQVQCKELTYFDSDTQKALTMSEVVAQAIFGLEKENQVEVHRVLLCTCQQQSSEGESIVEFEWMHLRLDLFQEVDLKNFEEALMSTNTKHVEPGTWFIRKSSQKSQDSNEKIFAVQFNYKDSNSFTTKTWKALYKLNVNEKKLYNSDWNAENKEFEYTPKYDVNNANEVLAAVKKLVMTNKEFRTILEKQKILDISNRFRVYTPGPDIDPSKRSRTAAVRRFYLKVLEKTGQQLETFEDLSKISVEWSSFPIIYGEWWFEQSKRRSESSESSLQIVITFKYTGSHESVEFEIRENRQDKHLVDISYIDTSLRYRNSVTIAQSKKQIDSVMMAIFEAFDKRIAKSEFNSSEPSTQLDLEKWIHSDPETPETRSRSNAVLEKPKPN